MNLSQCSLDFGESQRFMYSYSTSKCPHKSGAEQGLLIITTFTSVLNTL